MVTIGRPEDVTFLKALIFGPPGHGKTTLLGTAQEDERTHPMLLLDFEGGVQSLVGLDIDVARIKTWDDYNEAYKIASKGEYRSLGIDSISETHVFALLDILDKEGPQRRDPDLLQQGDYGKALVIMRRLLREFRDLDLHVFYTALSKDDVDPREGTVKKPSLSGALAEEVPGMMAISGYLAVTENDEGETIRSLLLQNYPKVRTKVRSAWKEIAPDEIHEPSVTKILDALNFAKE